MHSAADNGSAPRRKLLAAWRRMIARDCRFRSALGRPFTRAFVPRSHRPRLSLPFDARYFSSSSVFCWRYCITTRGACQGGKINFSKKFFGVKMKYHSSIIAFLSARALRAERRSTRLCCRSARGRRLPFRRARCRYRWQCGRNALSCRKDRPFLPSNEHI